MKLWSLPLVVGLIISAAAGLILIPWALKGQQVQDALELRAVQTQGTVVEIEPANHAQCTYSFDAGGKHYQSTGGSCADIPVGKNISIYYLPDDPSVSTNGKPGTNDPGGWIFVFWCVVVMPAFMVFIWLRHRLSRKAMAD